MKRLKKEKKKWRIIFEEEEEEIKRKYTLYQWECE